MKQPLEEQLQRRRQWGNFRELFITKNLIDFASNDYLGLARSENLQISVLKECENLPQKLGSTGSRLLTGHSSYVQDLEEKLAFFHGYEGGLLFNCGYMANVGLISAVVRQDDTIFFDAQVHASTHDGMRLSRGRAVPFRHNDLVHLESRLKTMGGKGQRFICVESIYSIDGSIAPLKEINRLSESYGCHLLVDEAHAVGVWGPQGKGLVAENQLERKVFAQVTTFGKAVGICGAMVFGSRILMNILKNYARPFIYSTALPFHVLATINCSYQLFPWMDNERQQIKQLIQCFRKTPLPSSETQIQYIKIKGNHNVKEMAKKLALEGLDVRPLLSPTVRQGNEILRICLHAFNTKEQLMKILNKLALNTYLRE